MSNIPDDVMKSATNVATALLYPEVDDDGRAYLTQDHINIIASALVGARRVALEEAAKVAYAEYKRHNTGSGFDSQPARSTANRILEAIRALQSEER